MVAFVQREQGIRQWLIKLTVSSPNADADTALQDTHNHMRRMRLSLPLGASSPDPPRPFQPTGRSRKMDESFSGSPLIQPMSLSVASASNVRFETATTADARALAALHTAVAEDLTRAHGPGPWSTKTSETGVLFAMRTSRVFVAREGIEIVATLRLATKKPWAIDTKYFSPCQRPLYLLAMAVTPSRQRQGLGRLCLDEAKRIARAWPADAIRLDAFDADAGAGCFYARCGCTEVGRASYRNTPLIYFELCLAEEEP
jgi:GNAT superfamily N-acetyltransferase